MPVTTITTILSDGTYNAFPGLAKSASGKRHLVYRSDASHVGGKGIIYYKSASGKGEAYGSATAIYTDAGPKDARDPEITAITTPDGEVLIVHFFVYNGGVLLNAMRVMTSSDDGETWSSATQITTDGFTSWCAAATKIIQLADDSLLLAIYGSDSTDELVEVLKSTDYGATWATVRPWATVTDGGLEEPNLCVLSNGDILMTVRTTNANIYESISTDNGATWSPLVFAVTDYGKPHILLLPGGRVGMICRDNNTTNAVLWYRSVAGVWSGGDDLAAALNTRMVYASSFIDEDGHWEVVVCTETSGQVSNIYGLTVLLPQVLIINTVGSALAIAVNAVN